MIVVQVDNGPLQHYDYLGFVVVGTMSVSILMMYFINKDVMKKLSKPEEKEVARGEAPTMAVEA